MTPRSEALDRVHLGRFDRPFPVHRLSERVDHAADHRRPDRNRDDPSGPLRLVAFLDLTALAHENAADGVLFEVERQPEQVVRELDQLARHDAGESVDPGDTVADRDHRPDLGDVDAAINA
jgi:hypothetical protein